MADTEIKKNVSELNIDDNTYHLVDLEARRMFLKYYDKLHGPYGSITGVLAENNLYFNVAQKYIKLNNVYLAFIIGLDAELTPSNQADYWATYIIARTHSSSGTITKIPLNVGSKVSTDFSNNNRGHRFGINFGPYDAEIPITFWGEARAALFGLIRLNTFNRYAQDSFPDDFRQNSWSELTTRIQTMAEGDLALE